MTTRYMIERNVPNNSDRKKSYIRDQESLQKIKKVIDEIHEIFSHYLQFNFRLSLVQPAIITFRP